MLMINLPCSRQKRWHKRVKNCSWSSKKPQVYVKLWEDAEQACLVTIWYHQEIRYYSTWKNFLLIMPCGWLNLRCAAGTWLSVSLMGIFSHRQPLRRSNTACLQLGLWRFLCGCVISTSSKDEERLVWDTLFSEEGELIYTKKTLIKISGQSVKINSCKSTDSWAFQWAEVLWC